MNTAVIKPKMKVLTCTVQDTHVCIDVQYIDKILPLISLEIVPNSPTYVAGLINLEGKIIPVIDLAIRLGVKRTEAYSLDVSILLCTYGSHQAGLIIDDIGNLLEIEEEAIQMADEFHHKHSPFVGSVYLSTHLALLVNMDYIFPININLESLKNRTKPAKKISSGVNLNKNE